jgi:hypothetical protein
LSAYVIEGTPRNVQRPQSIPYNGLLTENLFNLMLGFVVAHEIGHLELGHMGNPTATKEDEYAADRFAMEAIGEVSRQLTGSWALGFWASQIALFAMEMLDDALWVFDRGTGSHEMQWVSEFYPSEAERRQHLYNLAEEASRGVATAAARRVSHLSAKVFSHLWYDAELDLMTTRQMLRPDRVRPSKLWMSRIEMSFPTKPVAKNA